MHPLDRLASGLRDAGAAIAAVRAFAAQVHEAAEFNCTGTWSLAGESSGVAALSRDLAMIILAVDPSVRSPGLAAFHVDALSGTRDEPMRVDATLVAAMRTTLPAIDGESRGARVDRVARRLWSLVPDERVYALIYEWPQVYRAPKSKGDPNDLVALAAVGAALAARAGVSQERIVTPLPAEWCGGLPKTTKGDPWKSPRGRRIASRLSSAEIALVPKSHDAIDAVGLGLWYLGRLEPRRVFPGAV